MSNKKYTGLTFADAPNDDAIRAAFGEAGQGEARQRITATPFVWRDPKTIPPRFQEQFERLQIDGHGIIFKWGPNDYWLDFQMLDTPIKMLNIVQHLSLKGGWTITGADVSALALLLGERFGWAGLHNTNP